LTDDNIQRIAIMYLIDAHTYKLTEVTDETAEPYAILSHRWDEQIGEISFRDMQNPEEACKLEGFAKIRKSCEQATRDRLHYVWVDTCCINKESRAELTEAINSMYRWYGASSVCYVFLADVDARPHDSDGLNKQIASCEWLTRGWTLQELLAPKLVVFYNREWDFLGTKESLSGTLTQQTGIDDAVLAGHQPLKRCSIAQRMSWASKRGTKRVEDEAYCLLGIFGVHMPMLYGEGKNAFLRLQEEIIKYSDDHSIFAWPITSPDQTGLLADAPAAFEDCQQIRTNFLRKGHSAYSMTNRGLSIILFATQWTTDTYSVPLDCKDGARQKIQYPEEPRLCIFLRRLSEDDQYVRVKWEGSTFHYASYDSLDSYRQHRQIEINVRQRFEYFLKEDLKERVHGFRIGTPDFLKHPSTGQYCFEVSKSSIWSREDTSSP
jgi:hypothetical protein